MYQNSAAILRTLVLAAIIGFAMTACPTGEDDNPLPKPETVTYRGTADDVTYELNITDGNFVLTVTDPSTDPPTVKTSKGKASKSGDTWTLTPKSGTPFTVTVSSSSTSTDITAMDGEITFDDGDTQQAPSAVKPDRWFKWVDNSSTATLDFSIASDDVCTITVSGTSETNSWERWKAQVGYVYNGKANTRYVYEFEAWTESGEDARTIDVQYYYNTPDNVYLWFGEFEITNERKTYTVYGTKLPKGGAYSVAFACANQTGTFKVKMLGIYDYSGGEWWEELERRRSVNFWGGHGLMIQQPLH